MGDFHGLYFSRYLHRRSVCADRDRIYNGIRHSAPYKLRARRHIHGGGAYNGIRFGRTAALRLDTPRARNDDAARVCHRARRIQAPAHRTPYVGHDLRHRRIIYASERGTLRHGRTCQDIPRHTVAFRPGIGIRRNDKARNAHNSGADSHPRRGAGAHNQIHQDRRRHARSFKGL